MSNENRNKGLIDLLEITPLDVKRNKKDTGWVCSVMVAGQVKMGDTMQDTMVPAYVPSDVQIEANKPSLCEVQLYAIDGDLIRKIIKVRKSA